MKYIKHFLILIIILAIFSACQEAGEESEITTDPVPTITIGMLQHNVYFYLNENVTDDEKAEFEEGLEELLSIEEIFKSEMGVPGETPEREVTDHSFAYSIFTWFETQEAYNVYAEHPIHIDFIDKYEHLWADVKVYDSEIIQTSD